MYYFILSFPCIDVRLELELILVEIVIAASTLRSSPTSTLELVGLDRSKFPYANPQWGWAKLLS